VIIENGTVGFSAKMISNELGYSLQVVKRYLRELLTGGHIKQIGSDRHSKIYISSKLKGNIPIVSDYDKIKNYIYYSGMPFTSVKLVYELDLTYKKVLNTLLKLHTEGYIKLIGTDKYSKVYILNRNYGEVAAKKNCKR
jgi:predicted transcriptional regulator